MNIFQGCTYCLSRSLKIAMDNAIELFSEDPLTFLCVAPFLWILQRCSHTVTGLDSLFVLLYIPSLHRITSSQQASMDQIALVDLEQPGPSSLVDLEQPGPSSPVGNKPRTEMDIYAACKSGKVKETLTRSTRIMVMSADSPSPLLSASGTSPNLSHGSSEPPLGTPLYTASLCLSLIHI